MYKKHIAKWGIVKNTRTSKKNESVELVRSGRAINDGIMLDKQLLDKGLRRAQVLHKQGQISKSSSSTLERRVGGFGRDSIPLSSTPDSDKISEAGNLQIDVITSPISMLTSMLPQERLLRLTRESTMFSLPHELSIAGKGSEGTSRSLVADHIYKGYNLLRLNGVAAWTEFQKLTCALQKDLQDNQLSFISKTALQLALNSWGEHEQCRNAIVRYLIQALEEHPKFGKDHPLCSLFGHFEALFAEPSALLVMYKCMLDCLIASGTEAASAQSLELQVTIVGTITELGSCDEAVQLCEKLSEAFSSNPCHQKPRLDILYILAGNQLHLERIKPAVHALKKMRDLAKHYPSQHEFLACRQLASTYWYSLDDIHAAETWFREAVRVADDPARVSPIQALRCMHEALTMFEQYQASAKRDRFILDYPVAYHQFLEGTEDKQHWRTNQPCSLGRSTCVCLPDGPRL